MRHLYLFCAILSLAVMPLVACAQFDFSLGAEAGVVKSGFLKVTKSPESGSVQTAKDIRTNTVRPAIGAWGKAKYRKHFFLCLGAQYYSVGNQYITRTEEGYTAERGDYYIQNVLSVAYHKIAMPITVGYEFKIRRMRANFFLGYKQDYYLSGSTKRTDELHYQFGTTSFTLIEEDPFAKTLAQPASRWGTSLTAGAGVYLARRVSINFSYSSRQYLYFGTSYLGTNRSIEAGKLTDILLSVRYSIIK